MPKIKISEETFRRLQNIAIPLADTEDSVISRLLDSHGGIGDEASAASSDSVIEVDPSNLPDLTHSRVVSAIIDKKRVKPGWNILSNQVLVVAARKAGDFVSRFVNVKKGKYEEKGFKYLEEIDLSVQKADTNRVCRAIVAIAQKYEIAIEIAFEWPNKEGASHPGKKGVLKI